MLSQILKIVGLGKTRLQAGLGVPKPRELAGQIVFEGDPTHEHEFVEVSWDSERLGPSFADPDKDFGTALEFPMATYKYLHRCSCGREIVQSVRSLI